MTVDWDMVQFKRKIIDNARYLFSNYIDTSKGLDALYNRPEVSSDSVICHKNYNMVRVTGESSGEHIVAWEIDDASKINKLYVRAKVNPKTKREASLILTDSSLENCILFTIAPPEDNSDFKVIFRKNGSYSTIYTKSIDLSFHQYYIIEEMIDFNNNTIYSILDNEYKAILYPKTLPSFDIIHLGLRTQYSDDIPALHAKDIFITWE